MWRRLAPGGSRLPADDGGGATDAVPGPHPEPPADLHERRPVITDGAGPWPRLHLGGLAPIHFGRNPSRSGRFGAPEGEYGVMYVAEDEYGAFVETFGRDTGVRVIDEADLLERGLAGVSSNRLLRLVDLTGEGLARIGADARLFAGDHGVARRWSAALREHPSRPDGIRYPCRHDPSRVAVALYDQAEDSMAADSLGPMLSRENATLLPPILRAYGFGLA